MALEKFAIESLQSRRLKQSFGRIKNWDRKLYKTLTVDRSKRDYTTWKNDIARALLGLLLIVLISTSSLFINGPLGKVSADGVLLFVILFLVVTVLIFGIGTISSSLAKKMLRRKYLIPDYEFGEDSFPVEVVFHDGLKRDTGTVEEERTDIQGKATINRSKYQKVLIYKLKKVAGMHVFVLQERRFPQQVHIECFVARIQDFVKCNAGKHESKFVLYVTQSIEVTAGRFELEKQKITFSLPSTNREKKKRLLEDVLQHAK